MNRRSVDILQSLMGNRILINELAEKYGVSVRTIRNDINTINLFLEKNSFAIIDMDRYGFCSCSVELSKMKDLLKQNDFYNYKLSKEERRSMISMILVLAPSFVTLGAVADKLCVSRATVVNDMEDVKRHLEKYKITVISHPNKGFQVKGPESAKRLLLWQEYNQNQEFMHEEIVVSAAYTNPEQETNVIRKIIQEQEHSHDLYLTDDSYESLLSYLWIMMKRVHDGNFIEECADSGTVYDSMARDILKYISQYCRLVFTDHEKLYLGTVLKSLRYMKRRKMDKKILSIQIVTRQFIEAVSRELNSNLNKDYYLFENLSSHLATSLDADSNMFSTNSMFFEITRKNPDVYQTVCNNQNILEEYIGRKLTDIESVYITIHICAALERKQNHVRPIRVVLACNGGVGTSQLLAAKLENLFHFQIVKVISSHEARYLRQSEADMVVSTVPLEDLPVPVVEVSAMMGAEDCEIIKQAEDKLRAQGNFTVEFKKSPAFPKEALAECVEHVLERYGVRQSGDLQEAICNEVISFLDKEDGIREQKPALKLRDLLTAEFIELDVECRNWREAVVKSAGKLLELGYIEERYVDAMIHNIELHGAYIVISPGFAMPHAGLDEGTKKAGMSLIRLKAPVEFGSVQPVRFFCCLSAVDNETHLQAFINLVNLLENDEFKKTLTRASTAAQAARIIGEFEYAL